MPQSCRICHHADRDAIEDAVTSGAMSLRAAAARFAVARTSLQRHLAAHLQPRPQPAASDSPRPPAPAPAVSQARTYHSCRYPFYGIGHLVKFDHGVFTTAEPELQALIEGDREYRLGRIVEVSSRAARG